VPFGADILARLYRSKADYVKKYGAAAKDLVIQRHLLRGDALKLIAQAEAVMRIRD
jgi:hypothetical protein